MARPFPGRTEVLRCLRAEDRALHVAEITKALELGAASRRRVGELLEQLALEGVLRALPGQRYRAAEGAGKLGGWEGLLSVHPRGFAFVNGSGHEDVFIPPNAIGAALHGDTVQVVVVARTPRGAEGRVESIVRRRNPRISGVLRRRRKSAWLEPDDERIRGPIVLDERAVNEQDGLAAVVNITRFPESAEENPEGELVAVLGTPGDAQVEVAKILARENIHEERDLATIAEADRRAAELSPVSLEGRTDLRKQPFLTIDPVDARDHDDAIYVERREQGYRAYVAIADVSEYVQPGSALDIDASQRCFTTYLPDRAVPMLPSVLAAEHCSLLSGRERYAMCAIVDLDLSANVQRFRLVEAVISVAAVITYEDAASTLGFIEGEPKHPEATKYKRDLRVLSQLAGKLRRQRMKRGALDLDLPEPRVELDPATHIPTNVTRRAKTPGIQGAYQMVEELMLLANERVARWLSGKRSPVVYRVHGAPDPERLEQLSVVAKKLGVPFEDDTLDSALGVGKWLKRLAKHPLKTVLEGLLLRSLKMAQYDTNNIGHFGLASDCYAHFTSPIRRYPDLLVHRLCKGILRGGPPQNSPEELEALRAKAGRASEIERMVLQAEREVVDLYRCLLMRDKVGEIYEARVTGMAGSGLYAVLDDPFVDVLIRYESLGPDRYTASDDGLSVFGQRSGDRVALGDRLTLVIEDVALLRRTIYGRRVPPAAVLAKADEFAAAEPDAAGRPPRRRDSGRRNGPPPSELPPPARGRRGSSARQEGAARPPPRAGKRSAPRARGARREGAADSVETEGRRVRARPSSRRR